MPRRTGLQLTQRIRAEARWAKLPIIALSSLASEEDIAKGQSVGVSQYLVKLDRDRLREAIQELTAEPVE